MSALRTLQFMVKGYRNFTKREEPLPPLTGTLNSQTFVITGGNSGIGFEAARGAALRGARVVLVCRDKKRGDEAVQALKVTSNNPNISLILCDLGDFQSMQKACSQLKEQLKEIDVLVHNGGCMLHDRSYTKEGIEQNFATNTLAFYYISLLTMPLMRQTSRTVVVSSGGAYTQKLQTKDIYMQNQDYDGTAQYARNKRQQMCIVEQFAKKYSKAGKFFTMHPGWADTPAVRTSMPEFYQKMKDKLKTAEEGADTILYLSMAPFEELQSGELYFDREVADKHLTISFTTYKQKSADRLMERLKELTHLQ